MVGVGEYLKRERESRGVTIEEICNTTRITRRFIIAIEEDNFDLMPGDTLIVGFLRNYAKAVGVNADEVIGKYYAHVKWKNSLVQEDEVADKTNVFSRRNIILVVVVFILLVGAYFFSDGQRKKRGDTDGLAVEESLSFIYEGDEFKGEGENSEASSGAVGGIEAPPPEKKMAAKEEVLTIKAKEETWVNVVIDGNEVKDILLKPGEEVNYKGKESFLFTTGNLQGIEVMHNGQPLSFEGNKKSVLKNYLITSATSANQ